MRKEVKIDMTQGSIVKCLMYFALPIFLGNLFQQLYNVVDSLIVGNFLGSQALAAVSSSGNLIFLMVGFFQGIAMGGTILLARFFGAKDEVNSRRVVHSAICLGLITSVILTLVGVFCAPVILGWMGTPESVFPQSVAYFQMYFAGSIGFVMYNIMVGILQAVGDSRNPLKFLIISSIINVALDLLFIAVFKMGVESAALATIISQLFSAILCFHKLYSTKECYRVRVKEISFDAPMLKEMIRLGLPAGLQNSIISLANVVVQSNINSFGELAMAGCGAYSKIEGFAFLPITSFAMALTTFVSQNIGAKRFDRVTKGAKIGILSSMVMSEIVGFIIFFLSSQLISIFDSNPAVVTYGVGRATYSAFLFFLLAYSHSVSAVLRGAGKSQVPMYVMLLCWCVIRVSILTFVMPLYRDITLVYIVYPITWSLSSLFFIIYYNRVDWLKSFKSV